MHKFVASIVGVILLMTVHIGPASSEDYSTQNDVLPSAALWLPAGPAGQVISAGTKILHAIWQVTGQTQPRHKFAASIKHAAEEAGKQDEDE